MDQDDAAPATSFDQTPAEHVARGTFIISMAPADHEVEGTDGYLTFTKEWSGELSGRSAGTFLSAGDPVAGSAGYVAIELMDVTHEDRSGTFTLLQLGTMIEGEAALQYVVAPGSGRDGFAGVTGRVDLEAEDGLHAYTFVYTIAEPE